MHETRKRQPRKRDQRRRASDRERGSSKSDLSKNQLTRDGPGHPRHRSLVHLRYSSQIPFLAPTACHGVQRLRNPYSPSDAFRPHVMKPLHLEGGATRSTRRGRDVLPRNPDQALSTSAYPHHDVLSDSSEQRYVCCRVVGMRQRTCPACTSRHAGVSPVSLPTSGESSSVKCEYSTEHT